MTSKDTEYQKKSGYYPLFLYWLTQPLIGAAFRLFYIGNVVSLAWFVYFSIYCIFIYQQKQKATAVFWRADFFVVLGWAIYMILRWMTSPSGGPSGGIGSVALQELRNFFWPIPVFLFMVLRGMSTREINSMLLGLVLCTPFSILLQVKAFDITSLSELGEFVSSASGFEYNTFVPYLTFSLFAGIYLTQANRSWLIKSLMASCVAIILVFILINPSRQSVLYIFVGLMIMLMKSKRSRVFWLFPVMVILGVISYYALENFGITENAQRRFLSPETFETSRLAFAQQGIQTIGGIREWLFGKGLHISLNKDFELVNPHNSYIFQTMRVGLIGMCLLYFPFVHALTGLIALQRRFHRQRWFDDKLAAFAIVGATFTLFHSFFGQPLQCSYNASVCWFAVAICVSFRQNSFETSWGYRKAGFSA